MINGKFYPEPINVSGRSTITIDANGVITMTPAKPLKMEVDEPEP